MSFEQDIQSRTCEKLAALVEKLCSTEASPSTFSVTDHKDEPVKEVRRRPQEGSNETAQMGTNAPFDTTAFKFMS